MFSTKHTGRVLKSDRRQRRSRKTTERCDRFNVGNDPGATGRIEPRDAEYNWSGHLVEIS
jgi:hypothetical protein